MSDLNVIIPFITLIYAQDIYWNNNFQAKQSTTKVDERKNIAH